MSDSILQVNQIKDKGGNATGITIADTTANVTIGNLTGTAIAGTFNGTIGDSATMSNKYWRTAKVNSSTTIGSGGSSINTSTQTNPYFVAGDGDTTNLPYSDGNLIKVVRAGIYIVNFQGTFLYGSSTGSRAINVSINYGTTTGNLANVSNALDQIANQTSSDDYGSATAIWVGHCAANSYLSFYVQAWTDTTPYIADNTRYTIALLRPL